MENTTLITVDKDNLEEFGFFCAKNKREEGYQQKQKWLMERMGNGLKIKILKDEKGKDIGFIEFLPGEHVWKPISAKGYMVIHCIMVQKKAHREKGYGSVLIQACMEDAKNMDMNGVTVATSEGPWVAGKSLFEKNGFVQVDQLGRFQLMVKKLKDAPDPVFINWEKNIAGYDGLHLIYSHQCPWHAKSVRDLKNVAENAGIDLHLTEIKNAKSAQYAPTGFGNFGLIFNGRLLEDHYISSRRFMNILEKELKLATFN